KAKCASYFLTLSAAFIATSVSLLFEPARAQPGQPERAQVVLARQAVNAGLWDRLQALVPLVRNDVLGAYPEYWLLRQEVVDRNTPLPMPAITRFLDTHRGTYL